MPDLSVGHLEALFAVLSSLKRHDVIAIDKLAERLGVEAPELRRDLELLQYSGVPPFGGGDLLPIELEDDVLMVTGAMPALDRPLRLGLEQALALVLALEIAGYAPDDELVAKLSQGAPKLDLAQIARTLRAGLAGHTTAVFEAVTEALTEDRALQIDYRRSDGELTSRTVEPLLLFTEGDQWYVCAHCRLRERVLNFRLSRIETAELGEVLAEVDRERGGDRGSGTVSHLKCDTVPDPLSPPLSLSPPTALETTGLPLARLRFADPALFSAAEWPGANVVSRPRGALEVDVPYTGSTAPWFARHVAAGAGKITVMFPEEARALVRAYASQQLDALSPL